MTSAITPTHAQAYANRLGEDIFLIDGVPYDAAGLDAYYDGMLPDGALTFKPAAIGTLDPTGSDDPDPDTGLGSGKDEGDEPPAHCCGNWSDHHIQACPEIRAALFAPLAREAAS